MKVFELITILQTYDPASDIIVYDDCTDSSYDVNCVDIDENDKSDATPKTVIFI